VALFIERAAKKMKRPSAMPRKRRPSPNSIAARKAGVRDGANQRIPTRHQATYASSFVGT
jgi:hypothetical protein